MKHYNQEDVVLRGRGHLWGAVNLTFGIFINIILIGCLVFALSLIEVFYVKLIVGMVHSIFIALFLFIGFTGLKSLINALSFKFVLTKNELIVKAPNKCLRRIKSEDILNLSKLNEKARINNSTTQTDSGIIVLKLKDGVKIKLESLARIERTMFFLRKYASSNCSINKAECLKEYKKSKSLEHKIERVNSIAGVTVYLFVLAIAVIAMLAFIINVFNFFLVLKLEDDKIVFHASSKVELYIEDIETIEIVYSSMKDDYGYSLPSKGASWIIKNGIKMNERYYVVRHSTYDEFYGRIITKNGALYLFSYKSEEELLELIETIKQSQENILGIKQNNTH